MQWLFPFSAQEEDDGDDVVIVESEEGPSGNVADAENTGRKRKLEEKEQTGSKRMRSEPLSGEQDDVITLD